MSTYLPEKRRANFLKICHVLAELGTCDRARVGSVLVRGTRIIATGYNGAPPGLDHCDDVGHDYEFGRCIRTLHAEKNALLACALHGVSLSNAVCFCTHEPCLRCTQDLYSAGIRQVFYSKPYLSMTDHDRERITDMRSRGLFVAQLSDEGRFLTRTVAEAYCLSSEPYTDPWNEVIFCQEGS